MPTEGGQGVERVQETGWQLEVLSQFRWRGGMRSFADTKKGADVQKNREERACPLYIYIL